MLGPSLVPVATGAPTFAILEPTGLPAGPGLPARPPANVPGLQWRAPTQVPVQEVFDSEGEERGLYATLDGWFTGPQSSLFINSKQVNLQLAKPGTFYFKALLPMTGDARIIKLTIILPNGSVSEGAWTVRFPQYAAYVREKAARQKQVRENLFSASFALGFSYVDYQETGLASAPQVGISTKANVKFKPPKWAVDFWLSGYFTALPITLSTQMPVGLRFLGVNGRVGVPIPIMPRGWTLRLYGGGYYTTTFADGNAYGFKDMAGPQLYPSISYSIPQFGILSTYFKYSPILSGVVPTFQSRELATGLAYARPFANGHLGTMSLDVSHLGLSFPSFNASVNSLSVSLSIGYQF